MTKAMKKGISAIIALLMVLSAVPFGCLTGIDWFGVKAAAATYAVGNVVKFGSYPQKQVTDVTLKAALGEVSTDNGYLYFNGNRYYRYKSNGTTYFYEDQPIYWRVLSVGYDGIYLLADKVLDQHVYYESYGSDITWENSSLRSWLNDEFYNTAFNASEKAAIRTSTLINDGTYTGPDTTDKIFVPCKDDMSSSYGLGTSSSRIAAATDFAKIKGVSYSGSGAYWWLRTRLDGNYAYTVYYDGGIRNDGLRDTSIGVRPALKLNLNSSIVESTSGYVLEFLDSTTGAQVSGVTVSSDGDKYTSGADGRVSFSGTNLVSNKTLTISKSGYATQTIKVSDLSNTIVNYIALEPGEDDPYGFKSQLSDISLGSTKVKGPTANLLGHEVKLFSADLGLKINLTDYQFKGQYDAKNKTYKVILGIKQNAFSAENKDEFNKKYEDYKNFFMVSNDPRSQYNARQAYNKIKDSMDSRPGTFGIKGDISVAGFFTFDVSDGKLEIDPVHTVECGLTVTAAMSQSFDVPFWYICYATYSLGVEGSFTGKWDFNNSGAFTANIGTGVSVGGGVGAKLLSKKIASCELGLNGKLSLSFGLPASSLSESMKVDASLSGYIKANLFLLSGSLPVELVNVSLYPTLGVTTFGKSKAKAKAPQTQEYIAVIDYDNLELNSRDYLNSRTSTVKGGLLKASMLNTSFNENAVYPYGYPSIVESGNNLIAVWVDDNGTKSDANATTLNYAVYNGSSWSKASPVYENGTADFEAEICSDGNNIYAIWQRATKTFNDDVTVEEYSANTELVVSEFDGASWTVPVSISEVTGLATDYSIYVDNGNVTIVWSENDALDCFGDEGTNTIYKSTYTDGTISNKETVETGFNSVNSLAAGKVNETVVVAYCRDDTVFVDGTAITNGDNNVAHSIKCIDGAVYYIDDNGLNMWDGSQSTVISTHVTSDYEVLTNGTKTAIIYSVNDGVRNELFVSYKDGSTFGEVRALTNYGKHINSYDAVMNDDGTITIAADVDNVVEEAEYPYSTTDFIIESVGKFVSVSVDNSISFNESDIKPGNVVTFSTGIKNIGSAKIDNVKVQLLDANGNELASDVVSVNLSANDSSVVSVNYKLPSSLSQTKVKLNIIVDGDVNADDNTAEAEFGHADVMLENYAITDNGQIIARVVNQGYETAEDIAVKISKFDEGEIDISTLEIGTLEPGARKSITFDVPEENISFTKGKERNLFLVGAETSTYEFQTANNNVELSLYPTEVEGVKLNKTELELATDASYTLFAEISPLTAFDKSITWITTDSSVADVDKNGNVTAKEPGIATITAISSNSDVVANCVVTVIEEKEVVNVTDISLDSTELTLNVGTNKKIKATIVPSDATYQDIIWTSSDEEVVIVDQTGKIYAMSVGEAVVTVKSADSGITKNISVEVKQGTYTVTWVINGEITTETYTVGDKINAPEAPEIDGYTFTGWTPSVAETMPSSDLTYTAVYKIAQHKHSYSSTVITNPTCTDIGYTTYTCECGDSYTDSYVNALGHNYVDGICSRCRDRDEEYFLDKAILSAKSELEALKENFVSDEAKAVINAAMAQIDNATSIDAINKAKSDAITAANNADKAYTEKAKLDKVSIKVASEKTIDYRSIVTIKATATDVPDGYKLAIYLGNQKVSEGDNKSVSYEYGELKSDVNYTVKVVDASGKVQKDSNGNEISKDGGKITCNAGFFKKLIAFFRGLFGSLPKVEIKP